jgi:ElaB/YqjD/DUF883 family membrane-anchored ribosome-binding protein
MSDTATEMSASRRDQVRESVKKVGEGLHEISDVARHAARDVAGLGKEKATHLAEEIEKHIREKPVQSVLIAAGVGVLIGMLLRR